MQDFPELKVWQRARQLTSAVYQVTKAFPKEELYGLTSQARRAAMSIAANIAEGRGCGTDRAFAKYLRTSTGSAYELECDFIIACDLGYVSDADCEQIVEQIAEVRRMINAFLQTLNGQAGREGTLAGPSEAHG